MITPEQIKAARKLLGWSAATLAIRSKRSVRGVDQAENGKLRPFHLETSMTAIQRALEVAGVEFSDSGEVRMRTDTDGPARS